MQIFTQSRKVYKLQIVKLQTTNSVITHDQCKKCEKQRNLLEEWSKNNEKDF